jgi:hypothetical protein
MSIAGCSALTAGGGDVRISVSILPFADGGAPTAPTFSAAVPVPEESTEVIWEDSLTVDVPAGTRRPADVRLELRKGEAVVATGSLCMEAPYAPSRQHSRTAARLSLNGGNGEADFVELQLSHALVLAPSPIPAQAEGEAGYAGAVGEQPRGRPAATAAAGDDLGICPEEPHSISAIAGRPMPPLALRCLRAENVEVQPAKVARTAPPQAAVPWMPPCPRRARMRRGGAHCAASHDLVRQHMRRVRC